MRWKPAERCTGKLWTLIVGVVVVASAVPATQRIVGGSPEEGERGDDARSREVRQFVEGYFRTWSTQDFKGYGECFAPESVVQLIDGQGKVMTQGRSRFLAGQRAFQAAQPGTEAAESIKIRFEGQLARVVVYWKLTVGSQTKFGYDHFTLMKHDRKWQIVNLVFYEVPTQN